ARGVVVVAAVEQLLADRRDRVVALGRDLADRRREVLDRILRRLRVAALDRRLRAPQLHASVRVGGREDRATEVLLRPLQREDPVGQALVGRDELGRRRRPGRLGGGGLRRERCGRQQGDDGD